MTPRKPEELVPPTSVPVWDDLASEASWNHVAEGELEGASEVGTLCIGSAFGD